MSLRYERRVLRTFYGLSLAVTSACYGQQAHPNDPSGTRQMYYLASGPKDSLPPVSAGSSSQASPQKAAPALHLGLRYNLALVDPGNNTSRAIAANRILRAGDCFAVELQSNRSGYLYVLAKQSSGAWIPLLPSPQMLDEGNVIDPGRKARIPKNHCFEIHDPPGTEKLFVVLSRDPKDFLELYEGIKRKSMVADGDTKVNSAVEHLNEKFGTRDIVIRRPEGVESKDDSENAVYVVNSSDKPTTTIVAQIEARHR